MIFPNTIVVSPLCAPGDSDESITVHEAAGMGSRRHAIGAAVVAMAEGFSLQWTIEPGIFTKKDVKEALNRVVGEVSSG